MIIAIEGSIGAGKTTMLGTLEAMGYTVVREPVEAWAHWLNGNGDRAFFQCAVLAWYMAAWKRVRGHKRVVFERSPFTSRFVFGAGIAQTDLGEEYKKLYDRAMDMMVVDMHVFLCTVPSICHKRIKKRGQPGDKTVTMDLLRQLDDLHWAAIDFLKSNGKRVYVL